MSSSRAKGLNNETKDGKWRAKEKDIQGKNECVSFEE
jgi:hypothetical protein